MLEDDGALNAGYGSNLTEAGTVECDAAVMLARSSSSGMAGAPGAPLAEFGSVAAASGIKNPISAARAVLENARRPDVLGRVPPMTLSGRGARDFAAGHGIEVVTDEQLICERARSEWEYWTTQLKQVHVGLAFKEEILNLEGASHLPAKAVTSVEKTAPLNLHAHQDTVGAVCLHIPPLGEPSAAAGVSSGGLLLKHPGRIGEAALYGAGCWAGVVGKADTDATRSWMACSVSGTGEAIMRANLARRIADELDHAWDARVVTSGADEGDGDTEMTDGELDVHQILYDVLEHEFGHSGIERAGDGCDKPTVGVLVMVGTAEAVRLYSAFTAASMAVAYAREDSVRAHILSQQSVKPGTIYVETHTLCSRAVGTNMTG